MAGDTQIRDLGPADLDALLEAYEHLHERDDPLPPRPEVERLWARICDDPALIYLGAFDGPRLVATCTAAIVPNLTRGARSYAVIENVVTRADARRRGAAHEFYQRNGFDKHAKQGFIIRK